MIDDKFAKINLYLKREKSTTLEIQNWENKLDSEIFEDFEKENFIK